MSIGPRVWWLVFVVLVAAGEGLGWLLWAQGLPMVGLGIRIAGNAVSTAWLIFGLIRWRQNPWVARFTAAILFSVAAVIAIGLFASFGVMGGVYASVGVWSMTLLFFAGLYLLRAALSPGFALTGVARTLLDEAIRMRVPLVFLVLLALFVPALPFVLDPEEQLRYRVETFLTWSLTATAVLLSLMTVFLAVGTITNEIGGRQIFLTMTKPVGRFEYLLGKWLGIMTLNLLLVVVSGAAIYLFTMLLARQPANDALDRYAVDEQVLVARKAVSPHPSGGFDLGAAFAERLERLRASEPGTYGRPGEPVELLPDEVRNQIQQQVMTEWFSLPPRGSRAFRFEGLTEAEAIGETVQLRLTPKPTGPQPDGQVYLGFRINGRPDPQSPRVFAEGQAAVVNLPSQLIENGVLEVEVFNVLRGDPSRPETVREQGSISFGGDGIQLLYRVGGFEANFVRTLAILWVRLGFLAMLGLAAGTFLGFPVACLLALLVYFAALGSGYLAESLQSYSAFAQAEAPLWDKIVWVPQNLLAKLAEGAVWDAIKIVIRLIGSGFMLLVPSFGDYNATALLSDGRVVSTRLVGGAYFWIGGVWTGTLALIAWLIFRNRELARVTV